MELYEFKKYCVFFHDGTVHKIVQDGNDIHIWMGSAGMLPEWLDQFPVTVNKNNCIKGILHFISVSSLIVNDIAKNSYIQNYDFAEILNLDVDENSVKLLLIWRNLEKEDSREEYQEIIIQAQRTFWEHADYVTLSE